MKVRYPVGINKEKIEIVNTGRSNIYNLSIRCQVTFSGLLPDNLEKIVKYKVPIENSESYTSQELNSKFSFMEFVRYLTCKTEPTGGLHGTSYQFKIQKILSIPPLPDNIQTLQDFVGTYKNVHLRFLISYSGNLSGIEKRIPLVFKFDDHGNPIPIEKYKTLIN